MAFEEVAKLKYLALRVIAENWTSNPVLEQLPNEDCRNYLLGILPTTEIPLELALNKIQDQIYWRRAVVDRWAIGDPLDYGGSWRRMYCERHLSEYLENLDPTYFDGQIEECEKLLTMLRDYVCVLKLRKLVPERLTKRTIDLEQDPHYKEPPKDDGVHHIPMDFVLSRLPGLERIYINVAMSYDDDSFQWRDFQFSVSDSKRIGDGIKGLRKLEKFSLTRSSLDQAKAAAILHGIAVNYIIREIDFSHCKLGDKGAHAIGAFLMIHPALEALWLTNNDIEADGLSGIVRGLLDERSCSTLKLLDLRLNPLGDDGAVHLSALLLRTRRLEFLNASGCNIGPEGGMGIAEVLSSGHTNFANLQLDLSNNHFGSIVGEAFEIAVKSCVAVTGLDVRFCGFERTSELSVGENVARNRAKLKKCGKTLATRSRKKSFDRPVEIQPPAEFLGFQEPHEFIAINKEANGSDEAG